MEQRIQTAGEMPLSNETMVSLISKIAGGDSSALTTFYDGTSKLVFGLIVRILGDRTAAEESLLDVYTQAWKQAASLGPGIAPLDWLTTLARNNAVARLHWSKRDSKRPSLSDFPANSILTVAPEQQKLARTSLSSIASAERELLEWVYYGGLSCAEIAAQIGKPLGAVKTHLRVGLSTLSESFHAGSGRPMKAGTAAGGPLEA